MSARRKRRGTLQLAQLNILALLVLLCAFVLVLTDDLEPESFLLLATGLAIPAKSGGYQTTEPAPVPAVPVPAAEPEAEL